MYWGEAAAAGVGGDDLELERRRLGAGDERHALTHPGGRAPAAPGAAHEPRLHRRVVADGIVEERKLERPAGLGRRQRRIVRWRGDGDGGRAHGAGDWVRNPARTV